MATKPEKVSETEKPEMAPTASQPADNGQEIIEVFSPAGRIRVPRREANLRGYKEVSVQ